MKDLDTNTNGKLSVAEMTAHNKDPQYVHFVLKIFQKYDINGDKELDVNELRTYLENECRVKIFRELAVLVVELQAAECTRTKLTNGTEEVSYREYTRIAQSLLEALDTDKNEKISVNELMELTDCEEFRSSLKELIRKYDTNGDGELDVNELRRWIQSEMVVVVKGQMPM
ncbi:unnamed protein product [Echinostoma caproni]|uniref:EF-hand domain-containing protein n=1 Tax=Echinostoma caproni TaxID=27848 RepID=A0A3P8GUH6_9TREM|nr:unnamed protein product [Echinostoma caproni]